MLPLNAAAAGELSAAAFLPTHSDRPERRFDIGCKLSRAALGAALPCALDEIVQLKKTAQLAQILTLPHPGDVVIIGLLEDERNQ